MDNMTELT